MEIKLLSSDAVEPTRAYKYSAGYDMYAAETVVLKPQEKAIIKTDIAVNIPNGYVGLLTSRSGVSSKTHLVVELGKIDADYHGNIGINIKNDEQRLNWQDEMNNDKLENGGAQLVYGIDGQKIENGCIFEIIQGKRYQINKGDRLAQLVVVPIYTEELNIVEEFSSETERGTKGYGSSGTR